MAVIQSYGAVQSLAGSHPVYDSPSSVSMFNGYRHEYAKIYRTQPNVRTVIDFIARNIAQLGLHLFERVDDSDRRRVTFHSATEVLQHPNDSTTRYRHIEHTVKDLGIYWRAYWLKVRAKDRLGLVRLPPATVTTEGGLLPVRYVYQFNGVEKVFQPSEIIHFRGYDPSNPLDGLSPMETLRRILAEENAASDHRHYYWRNAGQQQGFFEREADKGAGKWNAGQVDDFVEKYATRYTGKENAGKRPVLPPGMTFKPASFSARDDQLSEMRRLAMEICATAYHVPLPMVGIMDNANYSNVREMHKHLYQDCLGPFNVMIEEELELQLLPEFDGTERMYFEFNIQEKLKGSFEEQATSISALTGRKQILTQNEARARLNLPKVETPEADELSAEIPGATGGRPDDPDADKQPERAPQPTIVRRSA